MSEFEKKIKLDNFTEQLKSLVSNIRDASANLSTVLVKKKEAERELETLREDAVVLRAELVDLVSAKNIIRDEIGRTQGVLAELGKQKEEEVSSIKEVQREKSIIVSAISVLNRERREIEEDVELARGSASLLSYEMELINAGLKSAENSLSLARVALAETAHETKEVRESMERSVHDLEKEIADLKQKKEEEDGKIVLADEYIKRKENDIAIVTHRLQDLYREIKPGVALKI